MTTQGPAYRLTSNKGLTSRIAYSIPLPRNGDYLIRSFSDEEKPVLLAQEVMHGQGALKTLKAYAQSRGFDSVEPIKVPQFSPADSGGRGAVS